MTVNEQLLQLNTDELSPLEALTKLIELQRMAAEEEQELELTLKFNARVHTMSQAAFGAISKLGEALQKAGYGSDLYDHCHELLAKNESE